MIRFTQELIRIRSYSLYEQAVAQRVQNLLEEMAYDLVFRDNAGNVIGILVGSAEGPAVLLNSHMDTVRPENEEGWTDSPLSGRVMGGRIYGLGASDCKGGLAAQIYAGHVLSRSSLPLRGTLVIAATVAEKNGCSVGVRYLMDDTLPKLGIRPDLAILSDPTALTLCNGHEGWIDIDVHIEGHDPVAVHSASETVYGNLMTPVDGQAVRGERLIVRVSKSSNRRNGETMEATVSACCRLHEGEGIQDSLDWVKCRALAAINLEKGISVDIHTRQERKHLYTGMVTQVVHCTSPWSTNSNDPILGRAQDALLDAGWKQVPIRRWQNSRLKTGSAGSVLVAEHHIPTFGFGPGEDGLADAPNESVDVEKLVAAAYGTSVLVQASIGAAHHGWASSR